MLLLRNFYLSHFPAYLRAMPSAHHPLRLAVLWHQHQPMYRDGDRMTLPWTRLHALKDYLDITHAIARFPGVRQTVNVVPSLLDQLCDYADGTATDPLLELVERPADQLDRQMQIALLRTGFQCNVSRMIHPYPRFSELYDRIAGVDRDDGAALGTAAATFTVEDWRDLQVWSTLAWIGPYTREEEPYAALLARGSNYTEEEKAAMLAACRATIGRVIPEWRARMETGQIELSVTPYYHPILPLVCDAHAALEAMPNAALPSRLVSWPGDAREQMVRAVARYTELFGRAPRGCWPSEGSISDAAAGVILSSGIGWAASDDAVLRATLGSRAWPLAHCFPWQVRTPQGVLPLLFRDHDLSDAIGFVYSGWEPEAAAHDFYRRAVETRSRIIQTHGVDALQHAVLPVILDGENCWEYYPDNGRPFLEALFTLLENSSEIEACTVSEALAASPLTHDRTLGHIWSGSWINADFRIWIGHEEDNAAWDALADAREALLAARDGLSAEAFENAYRRVLIAEGSDWYWWYGDDNTAADQDAFDALFRSHLRAIYVTIGQTPPDSLDQPIRRPRPQVRTQSPTSPLAPSIDGAGGDTSEWQGAGVLPLAPPGGAMHQASDSARLLRFGANGSHVFLRLEGAEGTETALQVAAQHTVMLHFGSGSVAVEVRTPERAALQIDGVQVGRGPVIEAAIPRSMLAGSEFDAVEVAVEFKRGGHPVERVPGNGTIRLPLQ